MTKRGTMTTRAPKTSAARRSFLRAVGAGLAGFPFLRALEDSVAHAAGETPPQRFVTMYHPHGIAAETWAMRGADTETNFDLTFTEPSSGAVCPLAPLDPHKSRLLIIEGIDLLSNTNGHNSAGTILTGSRINSSLQRTGNSSLDQFLAVEMGLGKSTHITSLEVAVGTDNAVTGETLSYDAGGMPLPKIIDPVQAFDRLFAGLVLGDDPATRDAALRQQRLGKKLVDFLNADAGRLKARLAPAERQKLDQHMTALADLEKQIAPMGTSASCPSGLSPMRPVGVDVPEAETEPRGRALLRRDRQRAHRSHRARLRVRRHAVRDAVPRRPLVRRKPARPAGRQPQQRRAHVRRFARGHERQPHGQPRGPAARPAPGRCWRRSTATPTARWRG